MASVHPQCDDIIAHLPGVTAEVRAHGEAMGARARARLAEHRETGASSIEVTHGATDTVVSLVDEAALAIEFGRGAYTGRDGRRIGAMAPLRILGRELD